LPDVVGDEWSLLPTWHSPLSPRRPSSQPTSGSPARAPQPFVAAAGAGLAARLEVVANGSHQGSPGGQRRTAGGGHVTRACERSGPVVEGDEWSFLPARGGAGAFASPAAFFGREDEEA
jgi:hypothetical protein